MPVEPPKASAAFTDRIRTLATAYQGSRVLLTAAELGLFTVLQDEERSSDEVAEALATDPHATDRLMNALVALGLLEKRGGRFANTPDGRRLLVRGRPEYMANLAHSVHLWDTWTGLTGVVRSGTPAEPRSVGARGDDWLRAFIAAMHWRGGQAARAVLPLIDFDGVSRILDVGGGSGVFSMAFVRAIPGSVAVVFDLPTVVPLATSYIRTEGFEGRIEVVAGDYTTDELPGGFDLGVPLGHRAQQRLRRQPPVGREGRRRAQSRRPSGHRRLGDGPVADGAAPGRVVRHQHARRHA